MYPSENMVTGIHKKIHKKWLNDEVMRKETDNKK